MGNEPVEHGDIALSLSYFLGLGLPSAARVLDIGTRFGSFINALSQSDYKQAWGVDVDVELLRRGLSHYPNLRGRLFLYDGRNLSFPAATFDVVTMFDVIEHIPDAETYLGEVMRALRPGGRLVFQTPNRYVNIPWEIVQHRSLTRWRQFHCSLQTLRSLRSLLMRCGFEQICIEKFSVHSEHKDQHARKILGSVGPLLIRLARRLPLPLYPNFWGCARKPGRGETSSADD